MAITDQQVVKRAYSAIDKGAYRSAYEHILAYIFGTQRVDRGEIGMRPWFLLILAHKLNGRRESTREWHHAMRSAPDYSPLLEGDLRLREMRRCLTMGNLARAQGLRQQIAQLHRGDLERMLKYWEAVATLHTLARHHAKAKHTHTMIAGHRRKLERQASS